MYGKCRMPLPKPKGSELCRTRKNYGVRPFCSLAYACSRRFIATFALNVSKDIRLWVSLNRFVHISLLITRFVGVLREYPPMPDDPGLIQFCGLCLGLGRRQRQASYLLALAKQETGDDQEALLLGALALLNHVQLAIQKGPETHEIEYRVPDPDDIELPATHAANKGAASRFIATQSGLSLVLRYQRNILLKSAPPPEAPRGLPIRMDVNIRKTQTRTEDGIPYLRFSLDILDKLEGKPSHRDIERMQKYFGKAPKSLMEVATEGAELIGRAMDLYRRKYEWPKEDEQ